MDLETVDHLLTTTRSVRKRLDLSRPVDPEVIRRCIEIALQAPTGSNSQGWHFLVVTDPAKRAAIARFYKQAFDAYRQNAGEAPQIREGDPRRAQTLRIIDSATYLAEHLHEVPVLVVAAIEGRLENTPVVMQASAYGSILPAVWSLMLALRARGLGSAWTTLHLVSEQETAAILGIPEHVTQVALLPVAHFSGTDFKPARRLPSRDFIHWNAWGAKGAR
jgi:nitroreductase